MKFKTRPDSRHIRAYTPRRSASTSCSSQFTISTELVQQMALPSIDAHTIGAMLYERQLIRLKKVYTSQHRNIEQIPDSRFPIPDSRYL